MKIRILDRYLLWETAQVWLAVTGVLLVILLSNQFTRTLAQSAAGDIPREFLFQVVVFSGLRFLVLLAPVSLMLAVMLALGRLYKDQEIAAMAGCGASLRQFYRPFVLLALILSTFTGLLAFEWGPWAARRTDALLRDARTQVQYSVFEAGTFNPVVGGRAMFYSDTVSADGVASRVFAQIPDAERSSLLSARSGEESQDPVTGERVLILRDGVRHAGAPGRADYDVLSFDTLTLRISPPPLLAPVGAGDRATTAALLNADTPESRAELHWRLSAPLSVFLLMLIAVPLAHLNPREGRYAKLVWGVLAYLVYSNLLGIGQTLLRQGDLPMGLGLWWVHGLAALAAWMLIRVRAGGFTGKSSLRAVPA